MIVISAPKFIPVKATILSFDATKVILIFNAIFLLATSCETFEPEIDENVRYVRYEVRGAAKRVVVEFIDGDQKVKRTGVDELPWDRDLRMVVGDKLYLSAWSHEPGGGMIVVHVFVDNELFRTATNENNVRARIAGNAY